MRSIFLFCILLSLVAPAYAQSSGAGVLGVWKTIDDESGEAKSHVELYQKGGKVHGKIVQLLRKPADTVCEKCKGDKQNKPLVGMVIVDNLSNDGTVWKGGNILDPETGSIYGCSIWLEDGNLRVRGKHWSGLFRTQTWYRVR
jgi:uncharacterized protein (DUF2147 family)